MSEVAVHAEQQGKAPITPRKVGEAFHGFQRGVKEGFPSHEQELRAYTSMLEVTTEFFKQPKLPAEARTVCNGLFIAHKETATAPLDFFLTVGERMKEIKGSEKERYRYVADALQEELFAARTSLRAEASARNQLETLSSHAPEDLPEVERGTLAERTSTIKKTALHALEKDPAFHDVLARTTQYKETLASLHSVTEEHVLQETLHTYADLLPSGTMDDLHLHLLIGDTAYVQGIIADLSVATNDPDFTWHQLTKQEAFPSELYHSFDQLTVMTELVEIAQSLKGASPETKAAYFLPFLERGMNATLLEEMATGRFEIPDDFLTQQVETFLDFSLNYEQETDVNVPKKHGKTKKIVASALAAAILAVPVVSAQSMMDLQPHKEQTATEKVVPPIKLPPLPESRPASEQQTSRKELSSYHPQNTSPEKLLQGQKQVLWSLEGKELNGFYRNSATAKFDSFKQEWDLEKRVIENHVPTQTPIADIQLSGEKIIADKFLELPTRSDYALASNSLQIAGDIDSYSLFQTVDGSYLIEFDEGAIGKKIDVRYGLGKIDHSVIPQPTPAQVQEMLTPSITIEQLPEGSLKTFMQELQSSSATKAEKAKAIESYVKKHFVYSLDQTISDEYDRYFESEYFRRIFDIQRGDCDVINTAFIMLLRAQDIPARLVLGDAHTGGFINSDPKKITSSESHGWTEAYVDGGFMQLDATPKEMDEFTKKALKGNLDESLQFSMKHNASDIESLEQLLTNDTFIKNLLAITGINLSMLAGSMFLRRRNNRAVDELSQTLLSRTQAYLGPERLHLREDLLREERNKLHFLYDDPVFNPFLVIAPGGLVRLAKAGLRWYERKKVPYAKDLPEVATALIPNVTEYFTKVLGYDYTDAELNKYIRDEAYFESMRTIQFQMSVVVDNLAEQGNIRDRTILTNYLETTLGRTPQPTTKEEWEEIKRKQRDLLYQTCVSALQPTGWMARLKRKPDVPFSKEILDEPLEELLRLQLMKWKVQGEYQKLSS